MAPPYARLWRGGAHGSLSGRGSDRGSNTIPGTTAVLPDIVRPGSPGSQIASVLLPDHAPELEPEHLIAGRVQELGPQEWALWKPRWGAFHRTGLDEHLRKHDVSTVILAGCNYPNCPRATVYGASERDYRVVIASDAVSGILPLHLAEAERLGVLHARTDGLLPQLRS